MKKNSIAYQIKKHLGITVIRSFEKIIQHIDGNKVFFKTQDFHFVKILEANAENIRDEFLSIRQSAVIPKIEEVFIEQGKITGDDNWRSYMLTVYGYDFVEHLQHCPITRKCIQSIPLMTSAMFSILQPNKTISPHRGIYKGVLRCHLPLIVPDESKCEIIINGKSINWITGKCMIFDDTFTHSANNKCDAARVILFIDFMRPLPYFLHRINIFLFHLIARSEFIQEVLERSQMLDGVNTQKSIFPS